MIILDGNLEAGGIKVCFDEAESNSRIPQAGLPAEAYAFADASAHKLAEI